MKKFVDNDAALDDLDKFHSTNLFWDNSKIRSWLVYPNSITSCYAWCWTYGAQKSNLPLRVTGTSLSYNEVEIRDISVPNLRNSKNVLSKKLKFLIL